MKTHLHSKGIIEDTTCLSTTNISSTLGTCHYLAGGRATNLGGEVHNFFPSCLEEGRNFFQGFLGEGHNFFDNSVFY